MSKADILNELLRLQPADRREIFERIGEMEEQELISGGEPTAEEKTLLDRELAEFKEHPQAGSSWKDVEARLRKPTGL